MAKSSPSMVASLPPACWKSNSRDDKVIEDADHHSRPIADALALSTSLLSRFGICLRTTIVGWRPLMQIKKVSRTRNRRLHSCNPPFELLRFDRLKRVDFCRRPIVGRRVRRFVIGPGLAMFGYRYAPPTRAFKFRLCTRPRTLVRRYSSRVFDQPSPHDYSRHGSPIDPDGTCVEELGASSPRPRGKARDHPISHRAVDDFE
jgi:hypothetical protein